MKRESRRQAGRRRRQQVFLKGGTTCAKDVSLATAAGLALAFAGHPAAAEASRSASRPGLSTRSTRSCSLAWRRRRRPRRRRGHGDSADLGVDVQTPLLSAMVTRGDLNYIITAPTDEVRWWARLGRRRPRHRGHHGRHVPRRRRLRSKDRSSSDLAYIGSDNVKAAASRRAAAKAIGGKGIVYINSINPDVSLVEGREPASRRRWRKISRTSRWRVRTSTWTTPTRRHSRLRQCWRANPARRASLAPTCSARGRGTAVVNAGLGGHVQVVAYDATSEAIELMGNGASSRSSWRRSRSTWAISR